MLWPPALLRNMKLSQGWATAMWISPTLNSCSTPSDFSHLHIQTENLQQKKNIQKIETTARTQICGKIIHLFPRNTQSLYILRSTPEAKELMFNVFDLNPHP